MAIRDEDRQAAWRYAQAQCTDAQILSALRHRVREAAAVVGAVPDLQGLDVFSAAVALELCDARDHGRAEVARVVYEGATGQIELDAAQCSLAQFFLRAHCGLEASTDAATEQAKRIAQMSDAEKRETFARVAERYGLAVVPIAEAV